MDRIYQDLKDRFVVSIVIYTKGTDGKAYMDSATTKQFTTSDLKEAFLKGAVIKTANGYAYPTEYVEASKVGSVKYPKAGSSSVEVVSLAAVADPT